MAKTSTEKTHLSDEDLLHRIGSGEVALFALLMKRYNQKLYRIARGIGIPDADCDDMIQQTYIQLYLKIPQFRGESAVGTWITKILINQCLMFLRKKRPAISEEGELQGFENATNQNDIEEDPSTPESEMIKHEMHAILERAIERLPDDYRVVYIMSQVEEMSVKDIAAALGITEANVKVRAHRARKLLRNELRPYFEPTDLYTFGLQRCDLIVNEVLRTIQLVL